MRRARCFSQLVFAIFAGPYSYNLDPQYCEDNTS